jgi:hypothetical protein
MLVVFCKWDLIGPEFISAFVGPVVLTPTGWAVLCSKVTACLVCV